MFLTILFDLTLFRRCRNVPLLVEGEGQQGEVCHPHPVMLSKAKHLCTGFLTGVRNDIFALVMLNEA
jgi:hypothetical protein